MTDPASGGGPAMYGRLSGGVNRGQDARAPRGNRFKAVNKRFLGVWGTPTPKRLRLERATPGTVVDKIVTRTVGYRRYPRHDSDACGGVDLTFGAGAMFHGD